MTRGTLNGIACFVFLLSAVISVTPARAIPPFWKEFEAKYVTDAKGEKPEAFAKLASAAKCHVCHIKDEKKTERNPFGKSLAELLDKDNFKKQRLDNEPDKAKQEILDAFEKVLAKKAVPDDDKSPTFGQLIAEGKLPGAAEIDKPKEEKKEEPKPEEKSDEEAAKEDVAANQTAKLPTSTGDLATLLFKQMQDQVKAELKEALRAELHEQLKKEIRAELKAELKAQLKESLKWVIKAELNAVTEINPEVEANAIGVIQEIGGTVMEIAQNDDSRTVAFHLSGKDLDDAGMVHLRNVDRIVELNLKDTRITNEGLANIGTMVSLRRLNLARTQISDEGLAYIKGLDNIVYLNLYGSQVTDAGLDHLVGMTNLRRLYLWQSQVTEEGVNRLREELPACDINFE